MMVRRHIRQIQQAVCSAPNIALVSRTSISDSPMRSCSRSQASASAGNSGSLTIGSELIKSTTTKARGVEDAARLRQARIDHQADERLASEQAPLELFRPVGRCWSRGRCGHALMIASRNL